jgi:hypothetical protein
MVVHHNIEEPVTQIENCLLCYVAVSPQITFQVKKIKILKENEKMYSVRLLS